MKRYKLKKDLPTFKAGDKFYLDSNNDLRLKGSDIMAYNHKTLEKFPNILTDWFEEILEYERRRADAVIGDIYHYIDDYGDIEYAYDRNDSGDNYRYNTGNYGLTKKDLENKREYDIARQILLDDAEGGRFVPFKTAYFARYTFLILTSGRWSIEYTMNKYSPGKIYFKDAESLKKSLEQHEEQWEIVRKYEMGEK